MLRYGLNKSQSTFKCRRYITQRNRELEREQQSNGLRRSAVAGGATDARVGGAPPALEAAPAPPRAVWAGRRGTDSVAAPCPPPHCATTCMLVYLSNIHVHGLFFDSPVALSRSQICTNSIKIGPIKIL